MEYAAGRGFSCGRLAFTEVDQHLGRNSFVPPAATRCKGELAFLIATCVKRKIHLSFYLPDRQHGELRIRSRAAFVATPSLAPARYALVQHLHRAVVTPLREAVFVAVERAP